MPALGPTTGGGPGSRGRASVESERGEWEPAIDTLPPGPYRPPPPVLMVGLLAAPWAAALLARPGVELVLDPAAALVSAATGGLPPDHLVREGGW